MAASSFCKPPALDFETPPGLSVDTGSQGQIVRLSGQWTALALARNRGAAARPRRRHRGRPRERVGPVGHRAARSRRRPGAVARVGPQAAARRRAERHAAHDLRTHRTAGQPARGARARRAHRSGHAPQASRSSRSASTCTAASRCSARVILDALSVLRRPQTMPWKETSANVYSAGAQALPITALVAFLIGIVLSYLSAQQLQMFGANRYIVNILGLSVIRELGPVLSAILVAGRSGSAITAQIGVMRVTEELDAMRVMGIPHGLRLILPRVLALGVAMPLLVMWTNIVALTGGALAAKMVLGIDVNYFVRSLPGVVPIANLYIGLGKGVVFGMLIALVACHFGFRIKANSQSLGEGTTTSVVTSITVVILADAVFAILFQNVGLG
ncbi:hypothetical protein BDAG_00477 [Burkholderia dolosa AU0158]|nr:hypothetical protein BDAG_00477 [Burkholderia dolosa AU0158]